MSGVLTIIGALDDEVQYVFKHGPLPSYLRPPDVIHVMSVPRPCTFFAALLPSCIILNAKQRTKIRGGGGWE